MNLNKFETLEERINILLEKLNDTSRKNAELENGLIAAKRDLEAAESLIGDLQNEREAVLAKVDSILARLE